MVRRLGSGVQFQAIDLETSNGLQLEQGQPVRLAESSGPLILRASEFIFFCVPTGQPVPWDRDARDPFASLRPREVSRQVSGHFEAREAIAGRLSASTPFGARETAFGSSALQSGVLVGRADRCDLVIPVNTVSRVHAVLLQLEDGLWIMDAGSTNGIWRLDEDLKIARVIEGDQFALGREVVLAWHGAH